MRPIPPQILLNRDSRLEGRQPVLRGYGLLPIGLPGADHLAEEFEGPAGGSKRSLFVVERNTCTQG